MANAERLKAVLAHIEAKPETWDQMTWHCGTTHCFGGHAQLMAGIPACWNTCHMDAEAWLELDSNQAVDLFHVDNTLADLRRIVADLCDDTKEATP